MAVSESALYHSDPPWLAFQNVDHDSGLVLDDLLWDLIRQAQRTFDVPCFCVALWEDSQLVFRASVRQRESTVHLTLRDAKSLGEREGWGAAFCRVQPELLQFPARLLVPIQDGDSVMGMLCIAGEQTRCFQAAERLSWEALAEYLSALVAAGQSIAAWRREVAVSQTLLAIAQEIGKLYDYDKVATVVIQALQRCPGICHTALALGQQEHQRLALERLHSDSRAVEASLRDLVALGERNLVESLIELKSPFVVQCKQDVGIDRVTTRLRVNQVLIAPMLCAAKEWGALFLFGDSSYSFDAYDLKLAAGIAQQVAGAAERTRLLAATRQQQEQLKALLSSLPYGVFLVDETNRLIYCNRQLTALLHASPQMLLEHSYRALFQHIAAQAADSERVRQMLDATLARLMASPVIDLLLTKPTHLHLRLRLAAARNEFGARIGWAGVISDPSHGDDEATQLSDLLANLSSQLRPPLMAIQGGISAMLSSAQTVQDGGGHREPALNSLREQVANLDRLRQHLFDASTMVADATILHRQSVALGPLIQHTLDAMKARANGHELNFSMLGELPQIPIDSVRVENVLRTLIEYTLQSLPATSPVNVTAQQQGSEILVAVGNHESSMSRGSMVTALDPARGEQGVLLDPSSNLALDLYLCRTLITAQGGRMWSASQPGGTKTIYFTLPLEATRGEPALQAAAPSEQQMAQPDWFRPVASEGVTVLIVDDDLVFLQTLKISLEKASYQVALASRGWDALDIVAQQPIDLVLLDLMLPDLDGFQVCERLREVSSVPIIIITARSQEQDMLHGLNAGADDYLVKPFSHKELLARVRAVLRRMHYPEVDDRQPVLQFGDLSLDFRRHEVLLRGDAVELTALEYRLLRHLACNAGRVFTHAQLLDAVWGPEYANETHYLWVCVSRLRRKLGDDASHPNYILTEAGTGYRFCRA